MKSKRTLLARTGAIVAFGAIVLTVAGCHHKAAEDFLAEGDADMQATKLSDAETAYQEAVKLAPNDPRTHIALGNLYIFEHKESDAQVEFMKVLEIDPKNAATHVALGNLYNEQNQHGLAENQYRAAVALEPDRANYHLDLGEVLRQEGKLAEAEDQIRTAIGLSPKDAKAHLALANLLATEPARAAEANAEFDEVRALDPKLMPAPAATPAAVRRRQDRGDDDRVGRADRQAAQQTFPVDEKFARLSESRPDQLNRRPGASQEVRSRHRHRGRLSSDQNEEWRDGLHTGDRGRVTTAARAE